MPGKAFSPYPWQRLPRLAMRIRYGQSPKAHRELDVMLDEFDQEHDASIGPRKLRCSMLLSYCVRGARQGGGPSELIIGQLMTSLDILARKRSWPSVRRFMHDYIDQMIGFVLPRNQSPMTRLISRIRHELTDNPMEALSLHEYADSVGVHPDYLSRKFKELTGQTYCQVKHVARIRRAGHLLISSNCKTALIAQRIGMNDVSQFIKIFKKETGQTPRQFRLMHDREIVNNSR